MRNRGVFLLAAVLAVCILTGCGSMGEVKESSSIVVVSPHPNGFIRPLIQEFERASGIEVKVIECGTSDAVDMIKNDEDIDVMWGGSILTVGPFSDLFYSYKTPNEKYFKDEFKSVNGAYTFFTDVPSVLIINTDMVSSKNIQGYSDLLKEEFKGRIAFANPARSSSSFEQLVNMLYAMGGGDTDRGWDYVKELITSLDGKLLNSSSMVYEGVANGKYAVGLTFEEAAVTMLKSNKHVSIVYMEEGVVSTPDGIYINKNTKNIEECQKFVDFLTDKDTQTIIAKTLGRRSVRKDVEVSGLVLPKSEIKSIAVDKESVMKNKEKWIEKFGKIYEGAGDE